MLRPFALAILIAPLGAQQTCPSLSSLALPNTTITSAAVIPDTPERCAVDGVIRPTKDSEIHFALWLPTSGWNGKYLQLGNGGWAGAINTQPLADPVRRGYAVAATDDGHQGSRDASWAIGHPEKLVDFGWRAVHQTAVQSKAIIRAFYGAALSRSYFNGCSDGGREALMEAQRFPEEFDGILAGAPANDWSHLMAGFVWNEQAFAQSPASAIPSAKLPAIQKAALAACDALDGVTDGVIEDPRACRFDPAVLTCKHGDAPDCLTSPQVAALRRVYEGPKNPRTGERIFPGYPPGTEAVPPTWVPWIIPANGSSSLQADFGNTHFGQAVFENPQWDFRSLNFDSDVALSDRKTAPVLSSINPDLRSFRANGGKLIQYHGWGDAAISPMSSIEYYDSVRNFLDRFPDARRTGAQAPVQDFYRLFMVPGMGHCGGGVGPNRFGQGGAGGNQDAEHSAFAALVQWVERGIAPDHIIGTGGEAAKPVTRPLCPYPQIAHYKGAGDTNDAANFDCIVPAVRR
jgi:feruloyl esterase